MGITREEMDAIWVCDGMAYRIREEFISEETRTLQLKYERAQKTRIPHHLKSYGKELEESKARDIAHAVDILRERKRRG